MKGTYALDLPVDFSVTGAGPEFTRDSQVSSDTVQNVKMRFDAAIRETSDGYWLDFTFGMAVPLTHTVGSEKVTTYHEVTFLASANLKPGKPLVILDDNGRTLTLTLTIPDAP